MFATQPEFTRPGEINDLALLHLNTSTGIVKTIAQPPGTHNWLFDRQGQLRVAQVRNGAQEEFRYRDSDEAPWRNWVGVTDTELLRNGSWDGYSDVSEHYRRYGMPELIGDRTANAAQFQATSPIAQAARITQPLLLAYGAADQRVPLYHGKQFYAAVTQHNRDVEWVVYDEEGHGWTLPKNRIDFWGRVEKFLDRNIGKDSVPLKKE